ncbi:unnamed protein product [Brassica rapa]|uniref:Uncharacterized protein n=1 Tax=Brassica campestris TaxID=3711 RepID=A0A3P5ZQH2_BRACM|nr:unnamed protein product [Brassica rapa]VDC82392.1 unnamed protein product [Brassica rapa]
MAGYDCVPTRMKRKEIDRVNDDFSDFSLSSPASKIRRLDLDLPPIMEEEVVMEDHDRIQSSPQNQERAIVLFKPPPQHHHQPHLFVDRSLISGLKNRFLHDVGVADEEDYKANKEQAVVPWNPSHYQFLESKGTFQKPRQAEIVELDGDDTMMEEADMDVEEKENSSVTSGSSVSLPEWQQPQQQQQLLHCMMPQLPQTNSTPISWFR